MRLPVSLIVGLTTFTALAQPLHADPCGLVPPRSFVDGPAIKRIGVQTTYVFFQNGVESIVLRPGFSGSLDEFGMLIPFPSPPAIRKVPDTVFAQIAAAIDPPEVVVNTRPQRGGGLGGIGGGFGGGGGLQFQPPKLQVRVLKEQAIGMYEVAVLEAGSAAALKTWMDDHAYRYPSGMDLACEDYIQQRWCFVAVKTKVKQKGASEPQPGQRAIDNRLPEGSTFDGHVQAMGFRFRVPRPVVPMRLSVHNPGDLRNVVYMLSDKPCRIEQMPKAFVVRQISGSKLLDHFRRPLPVRVIGGTKVPDSLRGQVKMQRNPRPHNWVAAELFASDILAARTGRLTHPHEELEMQLLAINEELGLQGPQIEQRVSNLMRRHNLKTTQAGLSALKDMALTVLDADFPRDVLATHNLTFRSYLMPLERSRRKFYDAIEMGPPEAKPGTLILGSSQNRKSTPIADPAATFDPLQATALLAGGSGGDFSTNDTTVPGLFHNRLWVLLLVAAGLVVIPARKTMKGRRRFVGWGAVLLVTMTSAVVAQAEPPKGTPALRILIQRLGDAEQASLAAAQLVASGDEALPALVAQSRSSSITRRGWAIICLGQLEAPAARQRLAELLRSAKEPDLIRIWAGAALIRNGSLDDGCRQSARQYPELGPLLSAER